MNIPVNEKAPVLSGSQIEITAPVEVVWKTLTDISNWPAWQKDVTETTVDGNIVEGTVFRWKAGGLSFKSQIHTCWPHRAFGWTGTTIGAHAVHNWTFIQKDSTTTIVKVEESLGGMFPKLFRKNFQKNLDQGLKKNLLELKEAAEQGWK